jgi:hypothetical protein
MKISISMAADLTGQNRATIRKHTQNLKSFPGKRGAVLFDSVELLQRLYVGSDGAPTNAEAQRQLAVAKTRQIQVDVEIKRKTRIPIDDVLVAHRVLFRNTVGQLKAHRNKTLTEDFINEILADWRAVAADLREQSDLANGQTAADRPPGLPWPDGPV